MENVFVTADFEKESPLKYDFEEVSTKLSAKAGINFFHYLKSFNLAKDPDLLILPPNNHYYIDEHELRDVRTIVNLRNFNLIENPDNFLYILSQVLPTNVNFIGCFSCSRITLTGESIFAGISKRLINLLDSRTDHNMDQKGMSRLLWKYSFKVADMTEIDGITYFYSQNIRQPVRVSS